MKRAVATKPNPVAATDDSKPKATNRTGKEKLKVRGKSAEVVMDDTENQVKEG